MIRSVKIAAGAMLACIFAVASVLFITSEKNTDEIMDVPEPQIVSTEFENKDIERDSHAEPAFEATPAESSPLDDGRYYVLRDVNGYLGIFSPSDASEPELITAVRTDSLRNGDIEKVKAGITVRGFENLLKLLEDFSS